jgi:hypothetical protein
MRYGTVAETHREDMRIAECVLYFKFSVGPSSVSGRADKGGCNR